jgi:hypothetical protein
LGAHDHEVKQPPNESSDVLEQNEEDQQCLQTLQKILERANSIIQSLKTNDSEQGLCGDRTVTLPRSEERCVLTFMEGRIAIYFSSYGKNIRDWTKLLVNAIAPSAIRSRTELCRSDSWSSYSYSVL